MNNEFLSDPWITHRYHKYTPNPKRWAWKNSREIKNQYTFTFYTNAAIGAVITSPFAIWIARRMNHYQGGVPVIPNNKYSHDFVNLDPGHFSRKNFRWYFFGICLAGGYLFASYTTNSNQRHDAWYSRPDLKPFPAMVPKEELDVTERTMLEAHYQSYRNKA